MGGLGENSDFDTHRLAHRRFLTARFMMACALQNFVTWFFAALKIIRKTIFSPALDIAFPPVCLACQLATAQTQALCAGCWRQMRFIERPFCEKLGTPLYSDYGGVILSPEAIANPPVFSRARAVVRFGEGASRALVHRLKYHDHQDVVEPMARWMTRAGHELLADADLLIPVPLHYWRLLSRRYNQSALLAKTISAQSGVPVALDILYRRKATHSQIGMTRAQRQDNVNHAFAILPEFKSRVLNKRIVLVDDVLTSGATANAASRVLLRAGAADVRVLVFARVAREGTVV